MFIDPSELIEVIVYYKKAGRHYVAYNETECKREKQKKNENDSRSHEEIFLEHVMRPFRSQLK